MRRRWVPVALCGLACALGCRAEDARGGQRPGAHDRGGQRPGAHDRGAAAAGAPADASMCAEHGVLEAVCTRCKPALAAVFKAKGDWCEAHGFPASFCPICHPERGGRPAADLASEDDGPADGTLVRLRGAETARLAGLGFARAVERSRGHEVVVTARVVYDATRVAQLNPRMPGVVRALEADVGATVRAGEALAIIESAEVGAAEARLEAARTRLEVADANHRRGESLQAEGIVPERELLASRREREDARAELRAAEAALALVGAGKPGPGRYALSSPIKGVVTQRSATLGRLVDREDILFEVVDPSTMWVELDVPEVALPQVAVGQRVRLELDGLPEQALTGTLAYVAPSVDPRTRTAVGRFPLANRDGALRANLFGRGHITVADARTAVFVPRASLQRARRAHLVFVRTSADTFEARRVSLGPASGDLQAVVGRVVAGDEVVTEGSFLLKTETLKESIGAGCCEGD